MGHWIRSRAPRRSESSWRSASSPRQHVTRKTAWSSYSTTSCEPSGCWITGVGSIGHRPHPGLIEGDDQATEREGSRGNDLFQCRPLRIVFKALLEPSSDRRLVLQKSPDVEIVIHGSPCSPIRPGTPAGRPPRKRSGRGPRAFFSSTRRRFGLLLLHRVVRLLGLIVRFLPTQFGSEEFKSLVELTVGRNFTFVLFFFSHPSRNS